MSEKKCLQKVQGRFKVCMLYFDDVVTSEIVTLISLLRNILQIFL